MTEKEFLQKARERHGATGDAMSWMTPDHALALAKEAGATFDPEPIEPVEIWSTGNDRLMFKPGDAEALRRGGFDGWRDGPGGTYRWEWRRESKWVWRGNDSIMAELARLKLEEWELSRVRGDWAERAAMAWYEDLGDTDVSALAAIIRKHAPRLKTVDETWQKIRPHGDVVTYKHWVVAALKDAGLPEGEP